MFEEAIVCWVATTRVNMSAQRLGLLVLRSHSPGTAYCCARERWQSSMLAAPLTCIQSSGGVGEA
jgi:hypothetical protein